MSLPSIFDYLPEQAEQLMKFAELKGEPPPAPWNKATLRAALKTSIPYIVGGGIGSGLGYGIKSAIETWEKNTGKTAIPPKYLPIMIAGLGAGITGLEAWHRKKERQIWRDAYEASQNRTGQQPK